MIRINCNGDSIYTFAYHTKDEEDSQLRYETGLVLMELGKIISSMDGTPLEESILKLAWYVCHSKEVQESEFDNKDGESK